MAADQALSVTDIEQRKLLYTFRYRDLPGSQPPATAAPAPNSKPAVAPVAAAPADVTSRPKTPKSMPKRKKSVSEDKRVVNKKQKHSPAVASSVNSRKTTYTAVKSTTVKSSGSVVKTPAPMNKASENGSVANSKSILDDPFAFDEPGKANL